MSDDQQGEPPADNCRVSGSVEAAVSEAERGELPVPQVTLQEAFWTWCRVAALSFGGPAGQIAVMHRILVDEKKWVSEERFLHALNYCMLLPGPEAQQLATYIGWLMHRTLGGVLAGVLFILPGFVSILALSLIYACWQQVDLVQAVFFGLKPAVLAIVVQAVLRISSRVLKNSAMITVAAVSFGAIFFLNVPFPLLILLAGCCGYLGGRLRPDLFLIIQGHGSTRAAAGRTTATDLHLQTTLPTWRRSLLVTLIFSCLWFIPLVLLRVLLGRESVLLEEGIFFSKAAVVTFGGAYSVLAYIAQQAVERYGWLQPGEMLDGLGMAETTPGPLIQVVQFVGFLGAYRNPGPFSPLVAGLLGSVVTTWVTFVPCFFWVFLGAPYIERLRNQPLISAALSTVTAAVVGVVLNLAIWFALHTLFGVVETHHAYGLRWQIPVWESLDLPAALVALLAAALAFYWKRGMAVTLFLSALAGVVIFFLFRSAAAL
jgi:chromate transporter